MSDPSQASEAEQQPELVDEQQIGGSPAARQVNDALRALSRSARAFSLYDPQNEAIRRFLGDFRDRLQRTMGTVGAIALEVKPFELVFQPPSGKPEVVYREEDRERSLAYRLFRDGVRRLTVLPTVTWDEQLRLLEILSVRYVGVRQQEDDLVTLLRKASFKGITFDAVEGFVAQNDEEDADGEGAARRAGPVERVEAPPDFDLPPAPPLAAKGFAYREVPAQYLQALQAEESAATVPDRALRLVQALLTAASDAAQPIALSDTLGNLAEIRDFFVADHQLAALLKLVTALQTYREAGAEELQALIDALGTGEQRARLIDAVPAGAPAPPQELAALFERNPGDHLPFQLDRLASDTARRHHVRALLARVARPRPMELVTRLQDAPAPVARELLGVLLEIAPDKALVAAAELVAHPEEELQLEVVRLLSGAPRSSQATELLLRTLASPFEKVRLATLEQVAVRHEARAFDPLVKYAEASEKLSVAESTAVGETLARLVPSTAQTLFAGWVKPKGSLLRRVVETPAQRQLQFVAVAGLGALRGEEPEQLIRELSARADEELKQHCVAVMVKRRREGRGRAS